MNSGVLFFGDNLDNMRDHISEEFDPPFNAQATYNVLFAEKNGTASAAQIAAFDDAWHWNHKAESTRYELITEGPQKLADLIQAMS